MHVVQKGDTVWTVSQKYNLDLRGIIEANHLSPPYALPAGTRLSLPAPKTYTVRGGDNLYTISRLFNTTQTEVATLNRLAKPYSLKSGQVLKVPNNYDSVSDVPVAAQVAPISKIETMPLASNLPPQPQVPVSTPAESVRQEARAGKQPERAPETIAAPQPPVKLAKSEDLPARQGQFLKPVSGKIISGFGDKPDGQHNDGINIQAARGDAVRAAENGQVVYIGSEIEGYGNMVLLRHQDGFMTAYAHLGKTLVKKGEIVRRGQTIGTVGATGFVDKPQLHFEIRKGKKAVDPSGMI